jgi:uncharacterized protein YegL
MDATKVKCLPVYIVIDTSSSMAPFENVLNISIEKLYDQLITSPRISDFARISIISYNTEAEVVLQMTDLQALAQLPELTCAGVTSFTKAVRLLRERIEADVPSIQDAGRAVLRPVAFLLTDGYPTNEKGEPSDAWKPDYNALVDPSYHNHPNFVPFGYGAATADIVQQFSTVPGVAFLAKDADTDGALQNIIPALVNTLVASARRGGLSVPEEVDGYIRISQDVL